MVVISPSHKCRQLLIPASLDVKIVAKVMISRFIFKSVQNAIPYRQLRARRALAIFNDVPFDIRNLDAFKALCDIYMQQLLEMLHI